MSILHHTYLYIENLPEGISRKMPQYILGELLTASLLLPLASANIRWPVSVQISATDASLSGGGRAVTLTSRVFAKALYRHGVQKGEHTRLDWHDAPIPPETTMNRAPLPLFESLMKHQWSTAQSCTFKRKDHINLLELEMLKCEIKSRVNTGHSKCRVVNLCDSRVVVGAFAKGRSSSKSLNHRLRSCLPWLLAGDLQVTNLWVDTHHNPADFPSRFKDIPACEHTTEDSLLDERTLQAVQKWRSPGTQALLEHEARAWEHDVIFPSEADHSVSLPSTCSVQPDVVEHFAAEAAAVNNQRHRNAPRVVFREFSTGNGRLTKVFEGKASFSVLHTRKLDTGSKTLKATEILDQNTFRASKFEALQPNQLWHFSLPCGSFSILQHLNLGTRRPGLPQGDGTSVRELLGNKLLKKVLCLIECLESAHNHWTLENPASSYMWHMPELKLKVASEHVFEAVLHQCAYGLKLKGSDGQVGPCRKHTRFVGNLETLPQLSKQCDCSVSHTYAVGGIRTKQGWKRRSALAGLCPFPLCHKYAAIARCILPRE